MNALTDLPAFERAHLAACGLPTAPGFQPQAWPRLRTLEAALSWLAQHPQGELGALRSLGGSYAQALEAGAVTDLLAEAARSHTGLRLSLHHAGLTMSAEGTLRQVRMVGSRLHVEGEGLRLALDESRLGSAWWVRLPTREGLAEGIWLYDPLEQPLLRLAGAPPRAERTDGCPWRALLARMLPPATPELETRP